MPFLFHWKKRVHQKKKVSFSPSITSTLLQYASEYRFVLSCFYGCTAQASKVYPRLTNWIPFWSHHSDNCSPLLYYLKYIYNHWYLHKLKSLPSSWRWVGILRHLICPQANTHPHAKWNISFTHTHSWKEHFKLGDMNYIETLLLQSKLRNIE